MNKFLLPSNIKLGTSTNLILGFNPTWTPGDQQKTGLFFAPKKPLEEKDISLPEDNDSIWSYPQITLHDSPESLLSAIFPFKVVNPSDGVNEAEIAAGPLLIGDHDRDTAISTLSQTIGINIGTPGYGFALVQLRRDVENVSHPVVKNGITMHPHPLTPNESFGVLNNFRSNMIKVRSTSGDDGHFDPSNFTANQAQKCLDLFQTYGTHFVSQVMLGDIIFQVFAYEQKKYAIVKKAYNSNNFIDENALNFLMYITDANGAYGFVKEYGKILSFSGDAKLTDDLNNNIWMDQQWSERNCIFSPYIDGCKINSLNLNNEYKKLVPISYNLTSLAIFAEFERRRAVKRVFKGVIIQKFKQAVIPHYEKFFPYDPSALPSDNDIPGFISTIATTNINTYKPNLNLEDMQFVASDAGATFTLCSNIISSAVTNIKIPGKDILIAFQTSNLENNLNFTTLTIDDAAFDNYTIACQSFYGCLQISDQSGKKCETINDGIRYTYGELDEQGRYLVKIKDDIRIAPDPKFLQRLKDSLTFSYTFADSILGGCSANNNTNVSCLFAQQTMRWLGDIIPQDCPDIDLIDLRVSALDAVRMIQNSSFGAFVPLLPPTEYQQQVTNILNYTDAITTQITQYQEIIDTRKTQELIIDVGKNLNDNIIQTAQLLNKFIQCNADQQRDLSSYYGSIINQKQAELAQSYSKINALQISLDEQRLNVSNAVTAYKQAVEDWKVRQEIQFGLDIATTIFSAVTAIAIPASSLAAVKDLGVAVQQIQKLLNILNNSYKVYTANKATYDSLNNAQIALNDLDDCNFAVNNSFAWDELNVNMSYILNCGPNLEAKLNLQREFSILVLRGKSLMSAKDSATQLAKDIYNQQRLNILSKNQQKRLDNLSDSLKPANIPSLNPLSIDLIGMTGSLMFLRSQMLGTLAKTLLLQDQSLQYLNLQPATVINSFDLLNFKGAIVRQGQNTINALTKLNAIQESTTDEISVSVKVPSSQISGGNTYSLNIALDNSNFHEYVNARVQSVMVVVNGISSTASGKYLVKLSYPGDSFFDRDPERNVLAFKTVARERTYEFTSGTNDPCFTDKGESWSYGVNPITPFSTWNISLPDTSMNKDIKFKDVLVDITLKFVLKARIVDATQFGLKLASFYMVDSVNDSPNAPSIDQLVATMQNRTVLNGWDAVFNMSLSKIQAALDQQYEQLKQSTSYGGKIDVTSITQATTKIKTLKKFNVTYGYPKVSFLANDPINVNLEIPIQSGFIQNGSQYMDTPIEWDPQTSVDPNALIVATVPIAKVAGLVSPESGDQNKVLSVVLDLASSTFTSKNMTVENDDDKASFNTALINYFTNNEVKFIINSLNLNGLSVLPDLCPSGFLFKTLITRTCQNQILQLFITTNNRAVQSYSQTFINDVDEPISIGDECSLMISSKVFFNSVMPLSLNKKEWHLIGVDPGNINSSWTAKFDRGLLSASVDLSALNHSFTPPSYGGAVSPTTYYTYYVQGGVIYSDINGMALSPQGNCIRLTFSQVKTQHFTEHWVTYYMFSTSSGDNDLSSDSTINISANMPVTVSGEGREQKISINATDKNCVVTGHLSGGGPCGCGDDLQAEFNQQLQAQIPSQIVNQMDVSFNEISLFALKNLLFVSNNYINFTSAKVPGDVLITGIFK